MHIFITIFALTWTNRFIFFHKGCYCHGGLLLHLFCMICLKLVCPTLVILLLLLRLQHCTFVILTCQLWNKQGRLQVLLFLASRGFIVSWSTSNLEELWQEQEQEQVFVPDMTSLQRKWEWESSTSITFLKMMFVSIISSLGRNNRRVG